MTAAKGLPSSTPFATESLKILFKIFDARNDVLQPRLGSNRFTQSGHSPQINFAMSEAWIVMTDYMGRRGLSQRIQALFGRHPMSFG